VELYSRTSSYALSVWPLYARRPRFGLFFEHVHLVTIETPIFNYLWEHLSHSRLVAVSVVSLLPGAQVEVGICDACY
jgi:hypothetical protein